MQVREIMSKNVKTASPEDTIKKAATLMSIADCGCIPVADGDRLVGVVTDRDIALRAVAKGKPPEQTKVREVMSEGIKYIFEDESSEDIARNMITLGVRRLPVLNREKRLVGIVSLADLALRHEGSKFAVTALKGVSKAHSAVA